MLIYCIILIAYKFLANECEGDPNAVPTPCSSSCPLTCENFQKPPIICTTVCSKSPCECKPGYVLDNGKCVLPTECRTCI